MCLLEPAATTADLCVRLDESSGPRVLFPGKQVMPPQQNPFCEHRLDVLPAGGRPSLRPLTTWQNRGRVSDSASHRSVGQGRRGRRAHAHTPSPELLNDPQLLTTEQDPRRPPGPSRRLNFKYLLPHNPGFFFLKVTTPWAPELKDPTTEVRML